MEKYNREDQHYHILKIYDKAPVSKRAQLWGKIRQIDPQYPRGDPEINSNLSACLKQCNVNINNNQGRKFSLINVGVNNLDGVKKNQNRYALQPI